MGAGPQILLAVVTTAQDMTPVIDAMKLAANEIKNL